ncbi:MAG: L-aspartate oxidase [Clostridia bacterium]|nr:L-aspartate oxidase [Clostridia bacterium]NCC44383.1 L-aspartate oxidase [Clostridia bacterium]
MKTDILIVGCGVAGLYAALNIPRDKKVTIITKSDTQSSDSYLAQGGICMLKNDEDYDSFFEDTMRAGHYENNRESVDIMIRSSRDTIRDLIDHGVDFTRKNGQLCFTREGAHSTNRILYHEDITGEAITSQLLSCVKKLENITLMEYTTMVDLLAYDNTCYGIVAQDQEGEVFPILAENTLLACGGIGGLYSHSTNFPHLTGDGLAVCLKHGISLLHVDYIQIHPTTFYTTKPGRQFLISESVRGEGALLYNKAGERFVDELLPRDVVTEKILHQMEVDGTEYVLLDMRPIGKDTILSHFPHIYHHCLEEGYDPTKECIPIVPAQHYFMGGIKVDRNSHTSMDHLYAAGETSCNGVHGANRLASNSLLESLVFAKRAALHMISGNTSSDTCDTYDTSEFSGSFGASEELPPEEFNIDRHQYADTSKLQKQYKELVLHEIERMKKIHE